MSVQQQLADRYQIGEEIGFGGMSEVYLAVDKRLHREVAVKILRAELASDRVFYLRFKREAENAAGLSHPNIAQVFDTGEIPNNSTNVPYIVMEYIDGETIREILNRENTIDPHTSLHWIAEVCDALQYSHDRGIIHRDMKPANIMIDHLGAVKVVDFGIARAVTDISRDLTQTATVIGTARYLSPEQATGKPVDARSDLYALGCVLFEMLTGRVPFTADTPVAVAYQHVREQPPLPSQLNPELSEDIDAVVLKALSKNPDNRYQSALEMRQDILSVLQGAKPTAPLILATDEEHDRNAQMLLGTTPHNSISNKNSNRTTIVRKVIASGVIVSILITVAIVTSYVMKRINPDPPSIAATGLTVPINLYEPPAHEEEIYLHSLGFNVISSTTTQCESALYDHIVGSSPIPGSLAEDHTINITICKPTIGASDKITMPNVRNMPERVASKIIQNLHLDRLIIDTDQEFSEKIAEGRVIKTIPPAGTVIDPKNARIKIFVSKGKGPKVLPDMIGTQLNPTQATLAKMGIQVSVTRVNSLYPPNQIVASSANTGADAKDIHFISLQVSTGSDKMPRLLDLPPDEARRVMSTLGYLGKVTVTSTNAFLDGIFHNRGKISRQSPNPNDQVSWNTPIQVWIVSN